MLIRFKILILVLLTINITISAQNKNTISQKEMISDLVSLDSILKGSYSFFTIQQKITGYNIEKYIKNKVKFIQKNKISDENFVFIVNSILKSCQNGHTRIVNPKNIKESYDSLVIKNGIKGYDENLAYLRYVQYYRYRNKGLLEDFYQGIKCRYIDGKYFTSLPIKYKGKIIPYGCRIISMNQKNIDSIVINNLDNLNCKWDIINNKYYTENFSSANTEIMRNNKISYSLVKENDTIILDYNFGSENRIKYKNEPWIFITTNKIKYFKKERILYIRLIGMHFFGNDKERILTKILDCKNKVINKVIIDIRGNQGGSDLVWTSILSKLIDKPLNLSVNIAVRNKQKASTFYYDVFEEHKKFVIPPFERNKFYPLNWNKDINNYLSPDTNSILYAGHIYIFQDRDIFSSANALSALCQYSDKLVSCGEVSGEIGGLGEEPYLFCLPNSKILFSVESTIDFTQINNIYDYLNQVEIPLIYNSKEFLKRESKNLSKESKRFLRKKDPYFRKIIEISE